MSHPSPDCETKIVVTVTPASAALNHSAAAPGNHVQFVGVGYPDAPAGCAVPNYVVLEYAAWSNPDPKDIQISSANNATNGTAVCLNATQGAVSLTGTFAPVTASGPAGSGPNTSVKTVTLTCQ